MDSYTVKKRNCNSHTWFKYLTTDNIRTVSFGIDFLHPGVHLLQVGVPMLQAGVHLLQAGVHLLQASVHLLQAGVQLVQLVIKLKAKLINCCLKLCYLVASSDSWQVLKQRHLLSKHLMRLRDGRKVRLRHSVNRTLRLVLIRILMLFYPHVECIAHRETTMKLLWTRRQSFIRSLANY
jgi:hypothetical protein